MSETDSFPEKSKRSCEDSVQDPQYLIRKSTSEVAEDGAREGIRTDEEQAQVAQVQGCGHGYRWYQASCSS